MSSKGTGTDGAPPEIAGQAFPKSRVSGVSMSWADTVPGEGKAAIQYQIHALEPGQSFASESESDILVWGQFNRARAQARAQVTAC